MGRYDDLRRRLGDVSAPQAPQASAPKESGDALSTPFLDAVDAEVDQLTDMLERTKPLELAPEPEIVQPQVSTEAAKAAVNADRLAESKAQRQPHQALREALGAPPVAPAGQTLEEAQAIGDAVLADLKEEAARRDRPWIDLDEGFLANAGNVMMKIADVQEDVFRTFVQAYNTVGPDVTVPGQDAETTATMVKAAESITDLRTHVKGMDLQADFVKITHTPQGNGVGIAFRESHDLFFQDEKARLINKRAEDGLPFTRTEMGKIINDARKYADDQMEKIVKSEVGKQFPLVDREEVPGEVARWLQSYPPAVRVALTGVYQDSATVVLPNGSVYAQDLTQNTLFGALDYGFNLISPAWKPLAAGAATGKTLTVEDMRRSIEASTLPFDPFAIMMLSMLEPLKDIDTGIPWDFDSEESLELMRTGKANIVDQYEGLGGAAGRKIDAALTPGEDASLAERGVGWATKALMMSTGVTAMSALTGWTEGEVAGGVGTILATVAEPDGFIIAGPLGKGAKLASQVKHAQTVAKVTKVMDTTLEAIDAAEAMTDLTPHRIANAISDATGVDTRDILDRMHTTRMNQLLAEDEEILEQAVGIAQKLKEAVLEHDDADAALKFADSEEGKALARHDMEVAKVKVANQSMAGAAMRIRWHEMSPDFGLGQTVDAGFERLELQKHMKAQGDIAARLQKIDANHADKLQKAKEAALHRDEMFRESASIQDERARVLGEADAKLRDIAERLRTTLGDDFKFPTTKEAAERLRNASPESADLVQEYRDALLDLRSLQRQYKPRVVEAKKRAGDARKAMAVHAEANKIQRRRKKLLQLLGEAGNKAARAQNRIDAHERVEKVKLLKERVQIAQKEKVVAAAKAKALRSGVLKASKVVPSAEVRVSEFISPKGEFKHYKGVPGITRDKYLGYAKQAMREIVESARDGFAAHGKVQDIDFSVGDDLIRQASRLNDAGERVIDGDKFKALLDKHVPEKVWTQLDPGEADLIKAAANGEVFSGARVAHLKRAINRGQRLADTGKRTPRAEMGEAFWRSVDDPNTPLWGSFANVKMRSAWRNVVNAFGSTARISKMAPYLGRAAKVFKRTTDRTKQELYEVIVDAEDPVAAGLQYLDSTEGITTRGGVTTMNQGDTSLYSHFVERVQGIGRTMDLGKDSEDAARLDLEWADSMSDAELRDLTEETMDLQAVVRSHFPDGVQISNQDAAAITRGLVRMMQDNPPKSAAALYKRLPEITAPVLGERRGAGNAKYRMGAYGTRKTAANIAGFTAGVTQGAALKRMGDEMAAMQLARHAPEDVARANNLLMGKMGAGDDLDGAVKVLNEMEMSINPRGGGNLGENLRNLVLLDNTPEGAVFAPKVLIDEINQSLDGMVKELHAINSKAPDLSRPFLENLQNAIRHVQVGLVRGYVVPKFKRFTNANIANFSQIWANEGLPVALQVALKSMPANITWLPLGPVFRMGNRLQAATLKQFGDVPYLGAAMTAVLNPHSGRIFAGETGRVTLAGREFSYDEIRRAAYDLGVMENTLRSELGPELTNYMKKYGIREKDGWKYLPGKGAAWIAKQWRINNDWCTRAVEVMEQRQRMELFMDGLDRGLTVEQAARRVENALYDWSSNLAQWETLFFAQHIPFYRVFRNSGAHGVRMLTEPFTTPDLGTYMVNGLYGQTQLGRTRAQYNLMNFYANQTDVDPNKEGRQARGELHPHELIFPGWVGGVAASHMRKVTPEEARAVKERTGKSVDQVLTLHPNLGAVEALNFAGSMGMALSGLVIATADEAGAIPGLTRGETDLIEPGEFISRLGNVGLEHAGLAAPELLEAIAAVAEGDIWAVSPISEGEAQMLRSLGLEPRKNRHGEWEMNRHLRAAARFVPFFGPQLQDVFKAYYDKSTSDEALARGWETFRHLVGDSRKYYGSSSEEQNRRADDTIERIRAASKHLKETRWID
jgi:hypothetical protein